MRVDDAGQQHLALEINDASVRPRERIDLRVRAHKGDLGAGNGNGLCPRLAIVDRVDHAVLEYEVGGLFGVWPRILGMDAKAKRT